MYVSPSCSSFFLCSFFTYCEEFGTVVMLPLRLLICIQSLFINGCQTRLAVFSSIHGAPSVLCSTFYLPHRRGKQRQHKLLTRSSDHQTVHWADVSNKVIYSSSLSFERPSNTRWGFLSYEASSVSLEGVNRIVIETFTATNCLPICQLLSFQFFFLDIPPILFWICPTHSTFLTTSSSKNLHFAT